uniref:Uncharacterized protein n=1 Tax=Moniliophthora roreri TaxID=221103 RepID=A0A0W0F2F8_MONRR
MSQYTGVSLFLDGIDPPSNERFEHDFAMDSAALSSLAGFHTTVSDFGCDVLPDSYNHPASSLLLNCELRPFTENMPEQGFGAFFGQPVIPNTIDPGQLQFWLEATRTYPNQPQRDPDLPNYGLFNTRAPQLYVLGTVEFLESAFLTEYGLSPTYSPSSTTTILVPIASQGPDLPNYGLFNTRALQLYVLGVVEFFESVFPTEYGLSPTFTTYSPSSTTTILVPIANQDSDLPNYGLFNTRAPQLYVLCMFEPFESAFPTEYSRSPTFTTYSPSSTTTILVPIANDDVVRYFT